MKTPDPKDPLLDQMIDQLEAALPKQHKDDYQKIVVAGMRVLFSDQTHKFLNEGIERNKENLPKGAIEGTVKLIGLIYQESQGKMKIELAVPAAITLMCLILDYAEAATGAQTSKDVLAKMIQALTQEVLTYFKIDQNKMAQGIDYARQNKAEFEKTGSVPHAQAPWMVGEAV